MSFVSRTPRLAGPLVLLTAMLAASPAVDDEIQGDLKLLQGTWTATAADGTPVTFEFKEDKVVTTLGDMIIESVVTIDEKVEPNKTIDFKIETGPPDVVGLTAPAIYKVAEDGKTVTICSGHPGTDRPADFEDVEGVSMLFELTKSGE